MIIIQQSNKCIVGLTLEAGCHTQHSMACQEATSQIGDWLCLDQSDWKWSLASQAQFPGKQTDYQLNFKMFPCR